MGDVRAKENGANELFEVVRRWHGQWLNPKELEEVRKDVEGIVELSAALRSVKLDNADEPHSVFAPYLAQEE